MASNDTEKPVDDTDSLIDSQNDYSSQNTGESESNDGVQKKEHTRSTMAFLFILGFFAILFLLFTYSIMIGASLSELKETLVAIIGALSGIIGFIVGYYYKSSNN